MPNENALFDLAKSHQNIMFTGLKNGELIGKREGLSAAAEICRRVASSYSGTGQDWKIHKSLAALECEAKILDEIRKLLTNADAQVSNQKDTDETGGAVNPDASAPLPWLQRTCFHEWEDDICVHCQLDQRPGPLPVSNHEMSNDQRLDSPTHGQAKDINK